jgi:hypothetical protein
MLSGNIRMTAYTASLQGRIAVPTNVGRYARRNRRQPEQPQRSVRVKLEAPAEPESGFVLMLGNGRRIASGWGFSDAALARPIRAAENA